MVPISVSDQVLITGNYVGFISLVCNDKNRLIINQTKNDSHILRLDKWTTAESRSHVFCWYSYTAILSKEFVPSLTMLVCYIILPSS